MIIDVSSITENVQICNYIAYLYSVQLGDKLENRIKSGGEFSPPPTLPPTFFCEIYTHIPDLYRAEEIVVIL